MLLWYLTDWSNENPCLEDLINNKNHLKVLGAWWNWRWKYYLIRLINIIVLVYSITSDTFRAQNQKGNLVLLVKIESSADQDLTATWLDLIRWRKAQVNCIFFPQFSRNPSRYLFNSWKFPTCTWIQIMCISSITYLDTYIEGTCKEIDTNIGIEFSLKSVVSWKLEL